MVSRVPLTLLNGCFILEKYNGPHSQKSFSLLFVKIPMRNQRGIYGTCRPSILSVSQVYQMNANCSP
uniref:Uncharacterized protein n=1 Tax=Anguilla anguilla TaxID=7936 RepID=A0A0E9PPF9_ANGAN